MVISLALRANAGVSLISLPRTEPIGDPQAFQAALQWHFGPDTVWRYWLDWKTTLELNSVTGVKTFEGLLDEPLNEPTVTSVCSGHRPSYLLAQQIRT